MPRFGRFLAALVLVLATTSGAEAKDGILLLAHGNHGPSGGAGGHGAPVAAGHEHHAPPNPWNDNVELVVKAVQAKYPIEVAFGTLSMW